MTLFGTASAWTLVDTFQAMSDRCPGTQFEPSNCVGCETCSRDLECQWTGRFVVALLLAQVISCCVKCRQTTQSRAPPGAEVQWLSTLSCQVMSVVEYVVDRVAHSRLALWPRGDDVWIGLAPDDDVYPEDLHCPRPDSGPRGTGPPGSRELFSGLPSRQRLRELIRAA